MFHEEAIGTIDHIQHKLFEAFLTDNSLNQDNLEYTYPIGQHGINAIGDLLFICAPDALMDIVYALFTETIG